MLFIHLASITANGANIDITDTRLNMAEYILSIQHH
jgi:hypothetical protein